MFDFIHEIIPSMSCLIPSSNSFCPFIILCCMFNLLVSSALWLALRPKSDIRLTWVVTLIGVCLISSAHKDTHALYQDSMPPLCYAISSYSAYTFFLLFCHFLRFISVICHAAVKMVIGHFY